VDTSPAVPQIDFLALRADGLAGEAVVRDHRPIQDQVGQPVVDRAVKGLVEIGCLGCEHVPDFPDVAVGRRARQAEARAEALDIGLVTEPREPEDRLNVARQRPGVRASAAGLALGAQQLGR
jgi:hypothetical protein